MPRADRQATPADEVVEDVLDPGRRICDAHHHLWDRAGSRFLLPELLADLRSGHNVASTVFIEWRSHYWAGGPKELRPIGETEFAARCADDAVQRGSGADICAAIISHVDLTLGEPVVARLLDAHEQAGKGRFRGIRHVGAWDASEEVTGGPHIAPRHLYRSDAFRRGLRVLESRGLCFDAWVFQTQHDELIELARAFPDLRIVCNHTGGVLGVGPYSGRGDELFAQWREGMARLAGLPNVWLKLGGLGMKRSGFPIYGRQPRAGSQEIAEAWRPWIETAIALFGAGRCMFESNFPVDGATCGYRNLWNAFKCLTAGASGDEKDALFHGTAAQFYAIGALPGPNDDRPQIG